MKIYFYKKCGVFEAYKKVSDFFYAEGLHGKHGAQMFSVFGYVYLADEKILNVVLLGKTGDGFDH